VCPFLLNLRDEKMISAPDDVADLVVYDPEYGVVICRPCQHAIKFDYMKLILGVGHFVGELNAGLAESRLILLRDGL